MTMVMNSYPTRSVEAPVHVMERLMILMWFVVTFTVFQYDELILYPLALYFFYAFFRHRDHTIPMMIKCWPLLLLPVWAASTSLFAVLPNVALRASIQMILTVQVAILIGIWLRPRDVVLTVFAATGICGILSLFITSNHDGAMTGIFAHKNMLGAKMLLLWTASLCVIFDRWMRVWVRLIGLGLAGLAFMLILASHSATALVLAVIIVMVIAGFSFFAGYGRHTPFDRFALALVVVGVLAFAIPILLSASANSPFDLLLQSLGKSRTLTGRTELWAYAEDVIQLRPWLGHGEGGFWRYEQNDLVRQIFAEFHKTPNQVFSFHSSFYEIAVHFGLIGLVLTIITIAWSFSAIFAQLISRGGLPFIFFPTIATVELARAFVESNFMKPFVMANTLIWVGAIYLQKYPLKARRDAFG